MKTRLIILIYSIIIIWSFEMVYSFSNEGTTLHIREIEALFANEGELIKFSRSAKYRREMDIVRNITGVAEYESTSVGVEKDADIGIALLDLDCDGENELLAYVRQSWFCSGGGSGCTLFVFKQDSCEKWRKILWTLVPEESISVLPTRQNGYHDLLFSGGVLYPNDETRETIFRYDQVEYNPYYYKTANLDHFDRITIIKISKYEPTLCNWKLILTRNVSAH